MWITESVNKTHLTCEFCKSSIHIKNLSKRFKLAPRRPQIMRVFRELLSNSGRYIIYDYFKKYFLFSKY